MPDESQKRLVLIDGHALAYRSFFAPGVPDFSTRSGEPTKATYLFTRALLNLLKEEAPDYLAVSFDTGSTFRHEMYEDYKGTREKMPDELAVQIERIHDVLEAFDIPILEAENYEADDVLGTIARLAEEMGVHTLIVTGDRDLLQLVNEYTLVQLPGRRSSDVERYDVEAVQEKYGLMPKQIVDLKALIGDTSDNIPGVAGVGEKTATPLLQEYETLDNLYDHLEEITGKRARNALEQYRDNAYLSYDLAKIITDVPIDFDLEACRTHEFDRDKVVAILQELEFRSILKDLPGQAQPVSGTTTQLSMFGDEVAVAAAGTISSPTDTTIVQDEAALEATVKKLEAAERIAFDTETTSLDKMQADLVGISLSVEPGEAYYIPVGHVTGEDQLPLEAVIERLRPVMVNPDIAKIGHNIKFDAIILEQHGLCVYPLSFDTMIGAWLAWGGKIGLKDLAFNRLGFEMTEITMLIGTGRKQITFDRVPIEQAAPYAGADSDMTLQLYDLLQSDLKDEATRNLFFNVEMPLVPVLVDMEQTGVLVNKTLLKQMSVEVGKQLTELISQVYEKVGHPFNLNSTQQLSVALFEELGLPTDGLRKTSSGHYSTAANVLESLLDKDTTGVIETILQYRELEKLRSTYLDALPEMVNPETGRIHSSFNQTGASTGRLSSSDPNLQNIPIRTEIGRRVRDAFIAAPGHQLIGADYSQVELRVMAHISGDEALKQAFMEDQDIHATTAASVYGIPLDEVTSAQRSFAKSVNFGLIYGMGAFRLARDSGLTLREAEEFIKNYFARFPGVNEYLEQTRKQARESGQVETLLGRRGYFPGLTPDDKSQRAAAAERAAINMPIQGTAADIIKIAMVKMHQALDENNLSGKMILQIHDELVLEVPDSEVEATASLIRDVMENAYPLDVPLKVDVHIGADWGALK